MNIGQRLEVNGHQYTLVELLGSGYTAKVYRAEPVDSLPGPHYAVKFLHPDASPDTRARFLGEVSTLTQLKANEQHLFTISQQDNLLPGNQVEGIRVDCFHIPEVIQDSTTKTPEPYFVMELMTGYSVQEHLLSIGKYSEPDALEIIAQLSWIFCVLHRLMNLTAQDLQLGDLYWNQETRFLKVIDWNVVKTSSLTEIDPTGDLVKIGTVLLYLLTGKQLVHEFGSLNTNGIRRIALERYPGWDEISPATQNFIARCLHPRLDKRYKSALEMLQEINKVIILWCSNPDDLLGEAEININEARRLAAEIDASNASQLIQKSNTALMLSFIAKKRGAQDNAISRYVENYSQDLVERVKTSFISARVFFEVSNYHDAAREIDDAIQAGWGLEAWRWKQATTLGVDLQERLTSKARKPLIDALDAMGRREWLLADSKLKQLDETVVHQGQISNLRSEIEVWQLLEHLDQEEARIFSDAVENVPERFDAIARKIVLIKNTIEKISDLGYQTELFSETGDQEKRAKHYSERAQKWYAFLNEFTVFKKDLDQNEPNKAIKQLSNFPTFVTEPMMQQQVLELCLSWSYHMLNSGDFSHAYHLLGNALLTAIYEDSLTNDIHKNFAQAQVQFLIQNGHIDNAHEVVRRILGTLSRDESAHLAARLWEQAQAVAPSLDNRRQELILELLLNNFSFDKNEQATIAKNLKNIRSIQHKEAEAWLQDVFHQVKKLCLGKTAEDLEHAEGILASSLPICKELLPTRYEELSLLLNSTSDRRQTFEQRTAQDISIHKFENELVMLEKATETADDIKDLDTLSNQLVDLDIKLKQDGAGWKSFKEFNDRVFRLKQNLSDWRLNFAEKMEKLIHYQQEMTSLKCLAWAAPDKAFLEKVIKPIWLFIEKCELPPRTELLLSLREDITEWSSKFKVSLTETRIISREEQIDATRLLLQSNPTTREAALLLADKIDNVVQQETLTDGWDTSILAQRLDDLYKEATRQYSSAKKRYKRQLPLGEIILLGYLARKLRPSNIEQGLLPISEVELAKHPTYFDARESLESWIDRLTQSNLSSRQISSAYTRAVNEEHLKLTKSHSFRWGMAFGLVPLLIFIIFSGVLLTINRTKMKSNELPTGNPVSAQVSSPVAVTDVPVTDIPIPTEKISTPDVLQTEQALFEVKDPINDLVASFGGQDSRWVTQTYTLKDHISGLDVPYRIFIGSIPDSLTIASILKGGEIFESSGRQYARIDGEKNDTIIMAFNSSQSLWNVSGLSQLQFSEGKHEIEFVFADPTYQPLSAKLILVWAPSLMGNTNGANYRNIPNKDEAVLGSTVGPYQIVAMTKALAVNSDNEIIWLKIVSDKPYTGWISTEVNQVKNSVRLPESLRSILFGMGWTENELTNYDKLVELLAYELSPAPSTITNTPTATETLTSNSASSSETPAD